MKLSDLWKVNSLSDQRGKLIFQRDSAKDGKVSVVVEGKYLETEVVEAIRGSVVQLLDDQIRGVDRELQAYGIYEV